MMVRHCVLSGQLSEQLLAQRSYMRSSLASANAMSDSSVAFMSDRHASHVLAIMRVKSGMLMPEKTLLWHIQGHTKAARGGVAEAVSHAQLNWHDPVVKRTW